MKTAYVPSLKVLFMTVVNLLCVIYVEYMWWTLFMIDTITIVTTNLPFSKWTELFVNTTMVAALIDRLTFRSHVLDMNGDSYRLKATIQSKV